MEKNEQTKMVAKTETTPAKKFMEETIDLVMNKITSYEKMGSLNLPADYSPANALRSAWLILQETKTKDSRPVLEACTRDSINNALFKMTIEGLSPVKKQCDFIAYGNKLLCQREYHGTIALAKRYAGIQSVIANVIYEKDVFEYSIDPETGRKKITKHEQSIDNIDTAKIRGAYAVVTEKDGQKYTEVMSMPQIRKSWEQGPMGGNSPAHKNFGDQMCIKTVINRACKLYISSSNDGALVDEDDEIQTPGEIVKEEIQANANKGKELSIEDAEEIKPVDLDKYVVGVDPAEEPEPEIKPSGIRAGFEGKKATQSAITGPGF
jgi:recombination protein RecT